MFNNNNFFLIIVVVSFLLQLEALAADDLFFNTLPQTILRCRVGGSLASVFSGEREYKSNEDVIIVDGNNKKMAIREIVKSESEDDSVNIEMFIEISNVTQEDLASFFIRKKIIRTNNALVNLALDKTSSNEEITVKTSTNDSNEPNAIFLGKITKTASTTFNGKDYSIVNGHMKIRFTEGLEGVDFNGGAAIIQCRFKKCPIVKTNLEKLKEEVPNLL